MSSKKVTKTTASVEPETDESLMNNTNGGFKKNILGLAVLTILYMIQGVPLGFFKLSISSILVEKGVHYKDLGLLSLISLPYSLKFFFAPILDAFYFKKFGQRKSYIVPIQYIYALICFLLSFYLQLYINEFNIKGLFVFGLTCIILIAVQDVAVDGWVLTILTEDYISYGPATQTIGLMLGSLISYNLFIPLNSTYFCNKYLYSAPKIEPLLTVETFWYLNALFVLGITVFVHFFVKEKELKSEESASFKEVVGVVKLFYKNPNLRKLSIVCLTQFISSMPIIAFFESLLIKNGFHKETFANISSVLFPIEVIVSITIGRICKKNRELRVCMFGSAFGLGRTIYQLFVLWYFFYVGGYYSVMIMVVIAHIATSIHRQVSMIAITSYSNKISNEAAGTTFLSTRAALGNFGGMWVRSGALFLGEYVAWYYICIGGAIFGIFYLFWYMRTMKELETKKKEEFYTLKKD